MAANSDEGEKVKVVEEELDDEFDEKLMSEVVDPKEAQAWMKAVLGKKLTSKLEEDHKFWDDQPVLKLGETVDPKDNGPIDEPKTVADIQEEPYDMPALFEWYEPDVWDEDEIKQIYQLLYDNYVEDDDNMFRFDYSVEFLQWALTPPGYRKDWHVAVRVVKSKRLVGFISAVPAKIRVYQKKEQMVEINFLCVYKKLRDRRMGPRLIREITRRVNRQDIWQAVYTAGIVLPNPVVSCRYQHRSLNPKKLVDIRFSSIPRNARLSMLQKIYRLPAAPSTKGLRAMEAKDVPAAAKLLRTYLNKFHLTVCFSDDEFAHWLLPRDNVINSYVVVDDQGNVTDLISFYTLCSSVLGNPKHKTLKAAYSFYNVATTTPLAKLMKDALILARSLHFDVFNALDIFENGTFFKELKFVPGDGHLQYYLYNWKCPVTVPSNLGLVML